MSDDEIPKGAYAWDPTEGMSPEERLGFELISTLEGRLVTDDAFRERARAVDALIKELHREIDIHRVLSRWNRRTWFQVMGYMVIGIANLVSVSRVYDNIWFGLAFPLVAHRGGPQWLEAGLRCIGAALEIAVMYALWARSQVPKWLEIRTAKYAMTEDKFLAKWPAAPRVPEQPTG